MISKNNHKLWKMREASRRVPHWSLRKLSIGVASVLLGTTFYFGAGNVAHADATPVQSSNTEQVTSASNVSSGSKVVLGQQSAGSSTSTSQASDTASVSAAGQGASSAASQKAGNVASASVISQKAGNVASASASSQKASNVNSASASQTANSDTSQKADSVVASSAVNLNSGSVASASALQKSDNSTSQTLQLNSNAQALPVSALSENKATDPADELTRTVTETINVYKTDNKTINSTDHQTMTYTRTKNSDGTYTAWKPSIANSVLPSYNITLPAGYEAYDLDSGDDVTNNEFNGKRTAYVDPVYVTPNMQNFSVNVGFRELTTDVTVQFQDKNNDSVVGQVVYHVPSASGSQTYDPVTLLKHVQDTGFADGYELYNGDGTTQTAKTVAVSSGDPQTVVFYVQPREITLTPDHGEVGGTPIPGTTSKTYPNGVENSDLKHVVTRTITFKDENGNTLFPTQTQRKIFTRSATINVVTGKVLDYTPWDPANGTQTFDAVTVPTKAGYIPSRDSISSQVVDGDTVDTEIDVVYRADQADAIIDLVDVDADGYDPNDKSSAVVAEDDIPGKVGDTGNIDVNRVLTDEGLEGQYVVEPGQATSYTIKGTGDNTTYILMHERTITVSHNSPIDDGTDIDGTDDNAQYSGVSDKDLNQTLMRTINITDPHQGPLSPVKQQAKIYRDGTLNVVTGYVQYTDWSDDNTDWSEYTPASVPGYTTLIDGKAGNSVSAVDVKDGQKDTIVNVTYQANDQTTHIIYQDKDGNVVKNDPVSGKTDQTVNTNSTIPAGWTIAKDSAVKSVPATITFKGASTPDTIITIEHGTETITPDKPVPKDKKTLSGKTITGAHQEDLNKTVTRTINITLPGQAMTTQTQTAKISRSAIVDDVDGTVTYLPWSTDGTDWKAITPETRAGYTTVIKQDGKVVTSIPAVTVDGGTSDTTFDVTYTANPATGVIEFVDDSGDVVGSPINLIGVTDQTLTNGHEYTATVPKGWVLKTGQSVPATVKLGATPVEIDIKITHKTDSITPNKPIPKGTKTPTGQTIDGGHQTDLNKTITRTINVTDPHQGALASVVQTVNLSRDGTVDEVTGHVTYKPWNTGSWADYKPESVAGYTTLIDGTAGDDIPAVTVTDSQQDTTVNVTYQANSQTTNIIYQDKNGKEIGRTTVNGETDQTVQTNAKVPDGWKPASGQTVPTTITFKGASTPDTIVTVEHGTKTISHKNPAKDGDKTPSGKPINGAHDSDLNQTITRTINVTDPHSGKVTTTKQVAKIYRDATVDEVSGEVTYDAWSEDNTDWSDFKPAAIDGYTVSQADVPAVDVKDGQGDQTINITYSANDQTTNIVYKDVDGNVIKSDKVTGKTDQTVDTKSSLPAGWTIAKTSKVTSVPAQITFRGAKTPDTVITVEHGTKTINHKTPAKDGDKTPSGKTINGAHDSDLNQIITRKINMYSTAGKLVNTIPQVAHIYRDATVDEVSGDVTYGPWSDDDIDWVSISPIAEAGYTMHISIDGKEVDSIPTVDVKDGQKDSVVNVTYSANDQVTHIVYKDGNGNTVGQTTVKGKTDQTVDTNAKVPAGWQPASGQTVPTTITFKGAKTPDTTVTVEHAHKTVTHDQPIPSGKTPLPGDPTKTYTGVDHDSLNKVVTRTINTTLPGQAMKTVTQQAHIYRDATVDEVTGKVTYTDWSSDNTSWNEIKPDSVAGYTTLINGVAGNDISAVNVTGETEDTTVNVTYQANPQQFLVRFVDQKTGRIVNSVTVKGVTDQTVDISAAVPDGWKLYNDQSIPTTIKLGATNSDHDFVIKHILVMVPSTTGANSTDIIPGTKTKHYPAGVTKADLNRKITRTIKVTDPSGKVTTKTQSVNFLRNAFVDAVDGTIVKLGGWSEDGQHVFGSYVPQTLAGYTINDASQVTVTPDSKDSEVDLTYTPVTQTVALHYVTDNGTEVANTTGQFDKNAQVGLTKGVPAGYRIVGKTTIDASDIVNGSYNVVVEPIVNIYRAGDTLPASVTEGLTKQVMRTIMIKLPNGHTRTIKQHVNFTRTATVDSQGHVTYGNWIVVGRSNFGKVFVPKRFGYNMQVNGSLDPVAVTAGMSDMNVVVTYVKK